MVSVSGEARNNHNQMPVRRTLKAGVVNFEAGLFIAQMIQGIILFFGIFDFQDGMAVGKSAPD